MDLVEKCQSSDFSFEVFRDNSGTRGLSVFVDNQYYLLVNDDAEGFHDLVLQIMKSSCRKITFGLRKIYQLGLSYKEVQDLTEVYDVQLLCGGEKNLFSLARERLDHDTYSHLADRNERFNSHLRAVKEAQMDTEANSLLHLIPANVIQTMLKLRCQAVFRIFEQVKNIDPDRLASWDGLRQFSLALFEVESNRIHVDKNSLLAMLKDEDMVAYSKSFLKNVAHMLDDSHDDFVRTNFSPLGSRTGRIKVDGSEGRVFNCMSIPNGQARKILTSRFIDGNIVSVDLNASDYRCLVASVKDEAFRKMYDGEEDFHLVNCMLLFGKKNVTSEIREAVKQLTYISIYGGSPETVCESTGMSLKNVNYSLEVFRQKLAPLLVFANELYTTAHSNGYVELPNGRKISVEKSDHLGKIVGLYAQSYSSLKFELALVSSVRRLRGMKSKILFTVHDEIVLDEHPDEPQTSEIVKECLEANDLGWQLVAKIKKGKDYFGATQ